MPQIAEFLKGNTTLVSFSIAKNYMKPAQAKVLADVLKDNGALSSLDISNNGLGAEGAKTLAPAL